MKKIQKDTKAYRKEISRKDDDDDNDENIDIDEETGEVKDIKITLKSFFADEKEKHGLRYTRFTTLSKNKHLRCLLYTCLNIKK